jgi:hypothetical protein
MSKLTIQTPSGRRWFMGMPSLTSIEKTQLMCAGRKKMAGYCSVPRGLVALSAELAVWWEKFAGRLKIPTHGTSAVLV